MTRREYMKMRGIPCPSPSGGDVPAEADTVGATVTAQETPEPIGGLPPDAPMTDTDAEPTGNRNRRRSAG